MSKDNFITGLDIGSTAIRMVVGERPRKEAKIRVIGAVESPSKGIAKGVIVDGDDAISSISATLEKTERMVGQSISHAWVGINGSHIVTTESRGVVAVSKVNGEIREADVERVVENAKSVSAPPNYEVLHVIPRSFTVDSQVGIKDPVGMTGIRLEVETQIIQGLTSQIKNLTNCVYRTGLEVDDLVLSILAAAESVLTNRQKDLGVVVINLGGRTTSLAVFEEGDLLHSAVIPLGSDHITNDINLLFRISIDTAEKIKVREGSCLSKEFKRHDEMKFAAVGGIEEGYFSKKQVAEVIEARVEEIFHFVDKELKKIGKSGRLPAGAVVTGGGAKLDGIVEVAKRALHLPASVGYPHDLVSSLEKVSDPAFTTAVGLVLWGNQMISRSGGYSFSSGHGSIDSAISGIRKIFKSLLP
jgi:cell division protein FtsA